MPAYEEMQALCKNWGITLIIKKRFSDESKVTDGQSIILRSLKEDSYYFSDTIHEIAHFIVAPESRRHMKNFGLGPPGLADFYSGVAPYKQAEKEEEEASLLGIALEKYWGLNWQRAWKDHSWDEYGDFGDRNTLKNVMQSPTAKRLARKGFLDRKQFLLTEYTITGRKQIE